MSPTLEQWCGFTSHKNQLSESAVRWGNHYFSDVITKAALSSQLFKDPECYQAAVFYVAIDILYYLADIKRTVIRGTKT